METQLRGKWAVVTGASSGIGEAVASKLGALGCNLILLARRGEKLEKLAQKILQENFQQTSSDRVSNEKIQIKRYSLDISNRSKVESFFEEHAQELQKVDILINNAGLARGVEKIQDANVDDWEEMIDTNLKGTLYITKSILKIMHPKGSGDIVNLGSVAGRWVYQGGAVYCATKFGISALTEGMRMDLSGSRIRVINIEPGRVDTEFSTVRFHGDADKAADVYRGYTPLSAEDVAETIVWCLQRPAHINIQELVIFPTDQASLTLVHKSNTEYSK